MGLAGDLCHFLLCQDLACVISLRGWSGPQGSWSAYLAAAGFKGEYPSGHDSSHNAFSDLTLKVRGTPSTEF